MFCRRRPQLWPNKVSLLSRRLWTAVNRGLILLGILDQWGYLTLPGSSTCAPTGPSICCGLGQTCISTCSFTATAEPKVSVQLLQQPLAERVSHRVQSFCPQQSESVSSAQTLGAEISPRSRLVDKHAVNNPSAHISTFFLYCLLSQHIESESEPPAMVTNYIAFQPRTSSLNPLIDGFNRWQSPQYVVDTSVTVPYKSLCFHHIK